MKRVAKRESYERTLLKSIKAFNFFCVQISNNSTNFEGKASWDLFVLHIERTPNKQNTISQIVKILVTILLFIICYKNDLTNCAEQQKKT